MEKKLSLLFFVLSISFFTFLFGVVVGRFEIFPYQTIREAALTINTLADATLFKVSKGNYVEFSDIAVSDVYANRVKRQTRDDNARPVIMYGGLNQYLDLCPGYGCLAVFYSAEGKVVKVVPYRPNEIMAKNRVKEYPYEDLMFDFSSDVNPIGIEVYGNGDLLVTFQGEYTFPYGNGIARIDPDGHPIWFRRDYSHHWPHLLTDETAMVPAIRIGRAPIKLDGPWRDFGMPCSSRKAMYGVIRHIASDGQLLREIAVLEALLTSPYRAVLQHSTDGCDPIHINFVDVIDDDEGLDGSGLEKGDIIVSMRNISAFGVISAKDGKFKKLVRGNFFQQHSVQHYDGARFILFDNHGADDNGGPSRMLMVDLNTGRERTVFPNKQTEARYRNLFSEQSGHIEVSKDRKRALVAFSLQGTGIEIGIPGGQVYRVFNNIHDVSSLENFPELRRENAAVFILYGVRYTEVLERK